MKTEVWLAFIFGTIFLLLTLLFALVAFYLPAPANPDAVGNFLFVTQVVLAISASGVAAVIPGFLSVNVQHKLGEKVSLGIRAGGAVAVFVLVFLVGPKSLTLDQLNRRVGFNEALERCRGAVPIERTPATNALQFCRDAQNFDPKRWEPYHQLGRLFRWKRQYDESVANYQMAFKLLLGRPLDDVRSPSEVKKEVRTSFTQLALEMSMSSVGLASERPDRNRKVIEYRNSLSTVEKGRWFASAGLPDQLYADLMYLDALNHAYIWLTDESADADGKKKEWELAVSKFKEFLGIQDAVLQWAQYHLSCLYGEVAIRKTDGREAEYELEARSFMIKSIGSLRKTQNEKSPIQVRLMQKLLLRPNEAEPPRGSEPMICPALAYLVKRDPELQALIADL